MVFVRWLVMLVLVAGCDQLFGLQPIRGDVGEQLRTRSITVTPARSARLVDFPVSIVMTSDADLVARAQHDGTDLYFTDLAGTALPFELVTYVDGSLEAWVRVTLEGTTELRMHYGGASRPIDADDGSAWSALYEGVWHLAEPGPVTKDSTDHNRDLAAMTPATTPAAVEGKVGQARQLVDNGTLQHEALCATPAQVIDFKRESFSYSAWVNAASDPLVGTYDQPLEAGGYTTGVGGFTIEYNASSLDALVSDDQVGSGHQGSTFGQRPTGRWVFLTVVIDRMGGRIVTYIDGYQSNSALIPLVTGNILNEKAICVGGSNGYTGQVDEVRVYNQPLTPEWIEAEKDNVESRAQFVKIDPI